VAVLRQGKLVAVRDAAGTAKAELAELMVGRRVEAAQREALTLASDAAPLLEVSDLAAGDKLKRANFCVARGEIFGIAGVSGNGQSELADALCGLVVPRRGEIRVHGAALPATPRAFVAAGLGRVPEDRGAVGVIGELSVWENAISERYRDRGFSRFGWLDRSAAHVRTSRIVEQFDVRCAGIDAPARSMSGGNIQKLILGRALITGPDVIVANQPTWGLDVGAVSYIHSQLLAARSRGAAVVLISDDLDELFALADRIAVMFHGTLSEARASWSIGEIGLAMAGGEQ